MKKQLIAFFTAGAIATSGISAPVQAGQADEFARLLMGAVIIGAIASQANGNTRVTVSRGNQHQHGYNRHNPRNHHHVRPNPPRHHVSHAPQPPRKCVITTKTRRGWETSFRPKCMKRNGWHRHSGLGWHPRNRH
ncbi:MAG: hypothetical protein KDK00_12935 [Rhodobacteraceae bacterium]|nr:hypothetical protein [Paracoccaceae bacterium]